MLLNQIVQKLGLEVRTGIGHLDKEVKSYSNYAFLNMEMENGSCHYISSMKRESSDLKFGNYDCQKIIKNIQVISTEFPMITNYHKDCQVEEIVYQFQSGFIHLKQVSDNKSEMVTYQMEIVGDNMEECSELFQ